MTPRCLSSRSISRDSRSKSETVGLEGSATSDNYLDPISEVKPLWGGICSAITRDRRSVAGPARRVSVWSEPTPEQISESNPHT
jgi:hypothetical protein